MVRLAQGRTQIPDLKDECDGNIEFRRCVNGGYQHKRNKIFIHVA